MKRFCMLILLSMMALTASTNMNAIVKSMEDLWGNPFKFDKNKLNVVSSISSATCGYCLVDGQFIKSNYGYYTKKFGGDYFLNSVFNSQRDLYAFMKHYGETDVPMLTYPPELRTTYQDGGYPYLYALRKNKLIYSMFTNPYEAVFDSLKVIFWKDKTLPRYLASPSHLSTRAIYENMHKSAVVVIPNEAAKARYEDKHNCYITRTPAELTTEDLQKDLDFEHSVGEKYRQLFTDLDLPLQLDDNMQWRIGGYAFDADSVSVNASFPNPYNTQKYLVIHQSGKQVTTAYRSPLNWLDFSITAMNKANNQPELVLYGMFKHDGNKWSYCDSLTYGINRNRECIGQCPVPVQREVGLHIPEKFEIKTDFIDAIPGLSIMGDGVRFPSVAAKDKYLYVAFETKGDIYLTTYYDNQIKGTETLEFTSDDSYDAIPVVTDKGLWVFYLKQVEGFYRLYGKMKDMGLWTDEVLISDYEPCDVITPAAAAFENEITVSWTVWQANYRYLYERKIIYGVLQPVRLQKIVFKKDFDYSNAWLPVMQYDSNGKLWKTWNQHYPFLFCVAAAYASREPELVSDRGLTADDMLYGYPNLSIDKADNPWIFYTESWGAVDWKQTIYGTYYDNGKWTTPFILRQEKNTLLQDPKAIFDKEGTLWVIWSERKKGGDWKLMYAKYNGDNWTEPIAFTSDKSSSRSPQLALYQDKIAVCYHVFNKGRMSIRTDFLR